MAPATASPANSLYPPHGPQSVGQVLDAGFRVFKVSLVRCLLFGAVAMIAGLLPSIYSLATDQPLDAYLHGEPVGIALLIIACIATVYFSAVMLIRQREIAQGRRQSTRADLAQGLRRLPSALGVVAVSLLLLSIVPVGLFVLNDAGGLSAANQLALGIGLTVVGLPILWALPGFAVSIAVAVLTESGSGSALRQGMGLVVGSWWRTMITFAMWFLLLAVFNIVAAIFLVMALPLIGATDVATVMAGTPVIFIVLRAIDLPFLVAILLTVYGELQVRRHGVDLERRVAGTTQA